MGPEPDSLSTDRAEEAGVPGDDRHARRVAETLMPGEGPGLGAADLPGSGPRYTFLRLHAEGGLGQVWVARDADLNREVALKEVRPEWSDRPEALRRFLREAQVTGQLEHPNIVPVYELARRREDGQPFYTMRLLGGRTLREELVDHHERRAGRPAEPLERQKLLTAFVAVCQAIGYAHSRGVVHRDLKPSNVMIGGFGEVLVIDWGLARMVDRPEEDAPGIPGLDVSPEASALETRGAVGTPAYMSPEQVEGRPSAIDARSDIYGLGVILFEILTGRPPFEGRDQPEIYRKITEGPTPGARELIPSVPRPIEAVALKAMARDPAARYARASELAEEVHRFLAGEPVAAWREPFLVRARRWVSRHRISVASASAAAVVGAIALGATLATNRARGMELVETLKNSEIGRAQMIADQVRGYRFWTTARLRSEFERAPADSPERVRLSLGLLPDDPGQVDFILERALSSDVANLVVLRDALNRGHAPAVTVRLWAVLQGRGDDEPRFRAACLLATYAPADPRWEGVAAEVVRMLLPRSRLDPASFWDWAEALAPAMPGLVAPLAAVYADPGRPEDRETTSRLLVRHARRPEDLASLVRAADESDFEAFVARMRDDPSASLSRLEAALAEPPPKGDEAALESFARRHAQAAIAADRLGRPAIGRALMRPAPDPTVRSWLIDRLGPLGVGPGAMADRLAAEADPGVRRALVLAMGGADPGRLPEADRRAIVGRLLEAYRSDPDPGLHSAIGWLLHLWKAGDDVRGADADLSGKPRGERGWFVNSEGQTFVVVRPPGPVGRPFAIATTEVTVAQFRRFFKDLSGLLDLGGEPLYVESVSPSEDCPVNAVHWYFAAMYCRWLSEREPGAIAPDQYCYPGIEAIATSWGGGEMAMAPGHLDRTGYRLPTSGEWEYACRAGSTAPRPFGHGRALLPAYAWFAANSDGRTHPVGLKRPNDLGLFDMLGNLREWSDDRPGGAPDDPVANGVARSRRGGCHLDPADLLRPSTQDNWEPAKRAIVSGFRVARTLD
jgi:serine/threonine protein kinase